MILEPLIHPSINQSVQSVVLSNGHSSRELRVFDRLNSITEREINPQSPQKLFPSPNGTTRRLASTPSSPEYYCLRGLGVYETIRFRSQNVKSSNWSVLSPLATLKRARTTSDRNLKSVNVSFDYFRYCPKVHVDSQSEIWKHVLVFEKKNRDSVKVPRAAGNTPRRFEILGIVSHYEILKLLEEAWNMRT